MNEKTDHITAPATETAHPETITSESSINPPPPTYSEPAPNHKVEPVAETPQHGIEYAAPAPVQGIQYGAGDQIKGPAPMGYPAPGDVEKAEPTQPLHTLTEYPARVLCPKCNAITFTETEYVSGNQTMLLACCLCFTIGCCCIPFCINGCKDVMHRCGNCKTVLVLWKRMGTIEIMGEKQQVRRGQVPAQKAKVDAKGQVMRDADGKIILA